MRPMLEAKNLAKTYGRQVILDDLSFVISEGAHIGLIGRNGAGKTTLFRLITGEEEKDNGEIKFMPWTKLGVIKQNETLPDDLSTLQFLTEASGRPEWEAAKLAAKFGIKAGDLALPPTALSGGYQMRVKIVRMLLDNPNLLLLDEPMNYLDLPTLLLLETFLRNYAGTFILISHDREAMQNICTSTWEIEKGELTEFPGDVETYLDYKAEQAGFARRTNKKLRREISHTQEFVDRFRYKASMASQAQSKLKHITKLRAQMKELGTALPTAAFRIPCPSVTSGPAVRAEDLVIGYPEKTVAQNITLEIIRGAKVAIVGENGHGKTTLLKTLADLIPSLGGKLKWWPHANIGYFSQMSEDTLNPEMTVLQALTKAAPASAPAERILAAAGAFLFRHDDLEKTCRVLSGGEKARVRLARLILQEHNVLILDEPTNHLDTETVEVLARAIKDYEGTVIIVCHARTFMNAFVDTIFEVRNGTVRHYTGTYEEYVADLTVEAEEAGGAGEALKASKTKENKQENAQLLRQLSRTQQRLDEKLKNLEKEKGEILKFYFENPTDYAPDKAKRLTDIDDEISQTEKEWLKLEKEKTSN
ncbi:MAG: ABC-F family ATP-binding cassette domain-containing protein [Patescibacteria group bacterium]|jgi:ATP-binding cassette subfamily F protein 3